MIYVMSDIHGNMRRFASVLRQIDLKSEDTLYILGVVIDRHPHGIKILRKIMAMPNAKMLLGNHEYMMLRAIGDPYDGPQDIQDRDPRDLLSVWYRNGGDVTHHFWKHTRLAVRAEILDYLKALPLNMDVVVGGKTYRLVHAASLDRYEEYVPEEHERETRTHFAVWNREPSLDYARLDGYTLVFGHTPTCHITLDNPMRIWREDQRIGIDCGAGFPDEQKTS